MARTFKGGIHPNSNKEFTKDKAIELLKAPDFVILPMSMHIGAPCEPLVKKGDYVYLGQKIGESAAPVSSPVHASISGTVRDIVAVPHANGSKVLSIIIDNDFRSELQNHNTCISGVSRALWTHRLYNKNFAFMHNYIFIDKRKCMSSGGNI